MIVFLCEGLVGFLVDMLEDLEVVTPCGAVDRVVFGVRARDVVLNI